MLAFMSPFHWKRSMETLCRTFKFLKAMQNIDPGWNLSWVPNASLANTPGGWGVCPRPLWVLPYQGAAAIWARNDGIPSGSSERRPSGSRAKSRLDAWWARTRFPSASGLGKHRDQSPDHSIRCPFEPVLFRMYSSFLQTRYRTSCLLHYPKQLALTTDNTSPCKTEALKLWSHPPWEGTWGVPP